MRWPFWRRNKAPPVLEMPWSLDRPLAWFGKNEPLTIGQAMEGILVFGGTGSGKSSGSQHMLATCMMAAGFSGMVLTAKPGEADRIRRMMESVGRLEDLIVFGSPHGPTFNFLDYQLQQLGANSGMTECLVNLMEEVHQIVARASSMSGARQDEQFWTLSRRELLRNCIDLLALALGTVQLDMIVKVIREAPRSPAEARNLEWQRNSCIPALVKQAQANVGDGDRAQDLYQVECYFGEAFPSLAEKTRSVVESSLMAMLDLFLRGKLFQLFGRRSSITPKEVIDQGKVIVIDMPVKTDFSVGVIGQVIWKVLFQQTLEAEMNPDRRPSFIIIDEFQTLAGTSDAAFAATARSSRCVNLWLTQSVVSLEAAMGGDEGGRAVAGSLMGLCNTRIFHTNSCSRTNEYAAELIGRRKIRMRGMSSQMQTPKMFSPFTDPPVITMNRNEQIDYLLQPFEFTRLQKGGLPDLVTEAIVYQGGRRWHSTNDTWIRTSIPQGF